MRNEQYSMQRSRGVISTEKLRMGLCVFALFALCLNFLLYSFFRIDFSRNIVRFFSAFLLLISIFLRRRFNGELVFILVAFYMFIINGSLTQNIAFLLISVLALDFDAGYVWKKISLYQIILGGVICFFLLTGMVDIRITSYYGRIRNSLGFSNVNGAATFIYSILILWLLKKQKLTWKTILFSLAVTLLLYWFTQTRTVILSLLVYLLGLIVLNRWHGRMTTIAVCVVEFLLFVIPQFMHVFYQKLAFLDFMFSSRLSIVANYIHQNSTANLLFGGTTVRDVDNFYICLLYNGGILFYLFILAMTLYSTQYYLKNKETKNVAYILSILAFGSMESGVIRSEIMCMTMFWYLILRPLKSRRPIQIQGINNFYEKI